MKGRSARGGHERRRGLQEALLLAPRGSMEAWQTSCAWIARAKRPWTTPLRFAILMPQAASPREMAFAFTYQRKHMCLGN